MPFTSGSAASALLGSKVAYCGGIDEEINDTINTCALLDLSTMTWGPMANMLIGVNHAGHCTDG